MRWIDTKPSCIACREIWENKNDESPCRACIIVLEEDNVDVVKVFLAVRHHVVLHEVSKDKSYLDLDIKAVKDAMDIYKVKNQERCYDRVRGLFFKMGKESVEDG